MASIQLYEPVIWAIVSKHLPALKKEIEKYLEEL